MEASPRGGGELEAMAEAVALEVEGSSEALGGEQEAAAAEDTAGSFSMEFKVPLRPQVRVLNHSSTSQLPNP